MVADKEKMNLKNYGAGKRQKHALRFDAGYIGRTAGRIAQLGTLSPLELRRLVADMVD